mmetsp:Transcript_92195/g.260964  ORF Transcript_92195/g.260964 Transcript_92195/m.260964 type:complete len:80 (-) Transcript_92195:343-582(-)
MATLRDQHRPLREAISSSARRPLSSALPQDLANIAWSYATRGCPDRPLLDSLAASSIRTMSAWEGPNIANIAWSFATLR